MTNVHFEKFTEADFQLYFQLVSNFNVMRMITERSLSHQEALTEFEKLLQRNSYDPVLGTYKVFATEGRFLGLAKLEIEQPESTTAELGYMLLPEFWGRGIGSIIANKLIKLAKSDSQLKTLTAIIDPDNLASRKILINNGFHSKNFRNFDGLPGEILELDFRRINKI